MRDIENLARAAAAVRAQIPSGELTVAAVKALLEAAEAMSKPPSPGELARRKWADRARKAAARCDNAPVAQRA